jgi:hypothetical protein
VKRKISHALANLQDPFAIEMDASEYAMREMLMQGGRPMCYHSKLFHGAVLNYPTYDKELFAPVQAVKKWKHHILGKETIVPPPTIAILVGSKQKEASKAL